MFQTSEDLCDPGFGCFCSFCSGLFRIERLWFLYQRFECRCVMLWQMVGSMLWTILLLLIQLLLRMHLSTAHNTIIVHSGSRRSLGSRRRRWSRIVVSDAAGRFLEFGRLIDHRKMGVIIHAHVVVLPSWIAMSAHAGRWNVDCRL